jgi:hypothetical protein
MSMPGFSADASAYESRACYAMTGTPSGFTATFVEPQLANLCVRSPAGVSCTPVSAFGEAVLVGAGIGGIVGGGAGAAIGAAIGALWCWITGCDD